MRAAALAIVAALISVAGPAAQGGDRLLAQRPALGRTEWPVTALTGRRGALGSSTLAVDTRYLYFAWEEGRGDIWVADIVQPPR